MMVKAVSLNFQTQLKLQAREVLVLQRKFSRNPCCIAKNADATAVLGSSGHRIKRGICSSVVYYQTFSMYLKRLNSSSTLRFDINGAL